MESKSSITPQQIDTLRKDFKTSLTRCFDVFGDETFVDTSKDRARQSMVYYDLLMHSLADLTNTQVAKNKVKIREAFTKLCASEDFQKTLSGGLQNKSSIERRRVIWGKLLARATK